MLIDDEPLQLIGLQSVLDWPALGFTIVGTETQVTAAIQQELAGLASVRRITGGDAYVRSVNIAKTFFTGNQPHINLASGLNPADGLCGGPMAVLKGGPLILTDNTATVNKRIAAYAKVANTIRATVFGGSGSVADTTVKTILAIK